MLVLLKTLLYLTFVILILSWDLLPAIFILCCIDFAISSAYIDVIGLVITGERLLVFNFELILNYSKIEGLVTSLYFYISPGFDWMPDDIPAISLLLVNEWKKAKI